MLWGKIGITRVYGIRGEFATGHKIFEIQLPDLALNS
jgi:hypothetical protein